MKLIFRTMVVLLALCLALPGVAVQADMPPLPPYLFYGDVTIGGIDAPDDTTVSAWIDEVEYASTATPSTNYTYALEVPSENRQPGDIVVFKVNGMPAESDPAGPITFEQGENGLELDLAIAADLAALNVAITAAQALTEGDYTVDSWAGVATALADALVVQDNPAATQGEVDDATAALTDAMAALVFAGQADLDAAVAAAALLTEADYTIDSWAVLETALALPEDTNAEVVDKTAAIDAAMAALVFAGQAALDTAVAVAGALTEADYTPGSWAGLVTALALPETTNAEVVAKTTAINAAMDALVDLADLTALDAAIIAAGELAEADYTGASWADVDTALTAALLVQADAEATQVEVDAATTALTDAIAALVFAGQADLDTAVAAAGALTEANYTAGSWADLETALALPETTNAEVVMKTTDINAAMDALVDLADLTALDAAITAAEALYDEAVEGTAVGEYAAGSKAILLAAIADAQAVVDDPAATQAVVDAAVATLGEAVSTFEAGIVEAGDTAALVAAIASAQALHEADYTAASWADLVAALDAAQAVVDDPAATQAVVDAATTALTDAIAALEFAGQADLDTAVADAGALTEADYTPGSWAGLVTALALPETTNAEVVAKTTAINDAILALVVGDTTDPVIEYAGIEYYIGAESARPGDPFEVDAVVSDDTAVTLVEVETPFGTFQLEREEYEGIAFFWVVEEVQDIPPGTYELSIRAEDAAGNTATQTLELEVTLVLESYNVWLEDGWNLISLPLIPDPTDTETVLDGFSFLGEDVIRELWGDEIADWMMPVLDSVWYYDAVGEYGTVGDWLYFEPATEIGDLTELVDGKGYWVDVAAVVDEEVSSAILTVYGVELEPGPILPPEYAVVEGWNLIGFKETSYWHFSEYLSAVEGKYARVYVYDAYDQCFYLVSEDGPIYYMAPGLGYWIYMTDDGYVVP